MWIEIIRLIQYSPLREVTPFAGVWIEILFLQKRKLYRHVTPFAGVWIEILIQTDEDHLSMSLPSRECGLKFEQIQTMSHQSCHSLRGSVD